MSPRSRKPPGDVPPGRTEPRAAAPQHPFTGPVGGWPTPKPGGLPVPRPQAKPAGSKAGGGLIDPFSGRGQAKAVLDAPTPPAVEPQQRFALGARACVRLPDKDSSAGGGLDAASTGLKLGRPTTLWRLRPPGKDAAAAEAGRRRHFQFVGVESGPVSRRGQPPPSTDKFPAASGAKVPPAAAQGAGEPAAPRAAAVRHLQLGSVEPRGTRSRASADSGRAASVDSSARTEAIEVTDEIRSLLQGAQAKGGGLPPSPATGSAAAAPQGKLPGAGLKGGAPSSKAPSIQARQDGSKGPRNP